MVKYKYMGKEYTSLTDAYNAVRKSYAQLFAMPSTNQEWLDLGVTCEVEDPSISLETEKSIKKKELENAFKIIRNSSSLYVNSSFGFPINANETAIINIIGLINELEVSGKETAVFRDFNNEFHEVTKDHLKQMQAEIARSGSAYYLLKWQYEESISNATTVKQVKDIQINFPNTIAINNE